MVLEASLDAAGHFSSQDEKKRESVGINLRNIFTLIPNLSKHEIQALRGVLVSLSRGSKK